MGTPLHEIGSFPLLPLFPSVAATLSLIDPLLAAFDLMINGPFGLLTILGDLSLEVQAALDLQLNAALAVSDPLAQLEASLQAIVQLTAGLQAAISLGLPTLSIELNVDLGLVAALELELGGLQALIDLALQVEIPLINFIADLVLNLNAGPVVLLSFGFPDNELLSVVGAECAALFAAGVDTIAPTDPVAGIMIVTKVPSAQVGLSFMMMTS